jgi:hypothetical protein
MIARFRVSFRSRVLEMKSTRHENTHLDNAKKMKYASVRGGTGFPLTNIREG